MSGRDEGRTIPPVIDLDEVLANSFRDFHVKGFDYLCLRRSAGETVKIYFFEGEVAAAPEVVVPHDHRYDFTTTVLAGASVNRWYGRGVEGYRDAQPFEEFAYRTPLNGGDGFSWRQTTWLNMTIGARYHPGHSYVMAAPEIHTIQVVRPGTVLCLRQFADVVPVGEPTSAFMPAGNRGPVNLSGLYRKMTADDALARVAQLAAITGETWALTEVAGRRADERASCGATPGNSGIAQNV